MSTPCSRCCREYGGGTEPCITCPCQCAHLIHGLERLAHSIRRFVRRAEVQRLVLLSGKAACRMADAGDDLMAFIAASSAHSQIVDKLAAMTLEHDR